MAKDPAFLFYPGDYISGTMHLDFECKGAYVDLLMLQFQKEHMTIDMIKHLLGRKFNRIWPLISDKFKENNGLYYNERLKLEKEKRMVFCSSRRENRASKKNAEGNHMLSHMENVNGIYKKGVKIRGISFSEDGRNAILSDGSIQELGESQIHDLKIGSLKPRDVFKGSKY